MSGDYARSTAFCCKTGKKRKQTKLDHLWVSETSPVLPECFLVLDINIFMQRRCLQVFLSSENEHFVFWKRVSIPKSTIDHQTFVSKLDQKMKILKRNNIFLVLVYFVSMISILHAETPEQLKNHFSGGFESISAHLSGSHGSTPPSVPNKKYVLGWGIFCLPFSRLVFLENRIFLRDKSTRKPFFKWFWATLVFLHCSMLIIKQK